MRCQSKFWTENLSDLFCSMNIVPMSGMSLAFQMNALTRLAFVVFLIMALFGFKYSLIFLVVSILLIIIFYYVQKKKTMSNVEHFLRKRVTPSLQASVAASRGPVAPPRRSLQSNYTIRTERCNPKLGSALPHNVTSDRLCSQDAQPLVYEDPRQQPTFAETYAEGYGMGFVGNGTTPTINHSQVGPPNPKTLVQPPIVPPITDIDHWRANNLVTHSAINDNSQIDHYRSGYQISTCCGKGLSKGADLEHGQSHGGMYSGQQVDESGITFSPAQSAVSYGVSLVDNEDDPAAEAFQFPYAHESSNEPGQVNMACGYNPGQVQAGLPTNRAVGNCQKSPEHWMLNENLHTQTVMPGVYTRSQVNEPVSANIGISHQQQFQPTTISVDPDTENVMFTEHDPNLIGPLVPGENLDYLNSVTEATVYDPRHSGYGTSYRAYTDDMLGQTKFYYDDVDSIRAPNLITRNNIDHTPFGDKYGPKPEGGEYGNPNHGSIREMANDHFLNSALQHRTELMERLMRKNNARAWQQRAAPIHTGGQRMLGGLGSCR